MVAGLVSLLLAQPTALVPVNLHVLPTSCPELTPDRLTERQVGELMPGSGHRTCPPDGPGRHIFFFDGFEGQRISFDLLEVDAGGYPTGEMNLNLSVTGPKRFSAFGRTVGASMLLTLPHTGRYELVVENKAPPGISRRAYQINATEHPALPPRSWDDCSRLSLPGGDVGIQIGTYFLRPGGSAVIRPTWSMNGVTYDARPECFSDWKVSSAAARLIRNRVGNWTLIVSPEAPVGTTIQVTATAGGQQAVNTINVDIAEAK